MAKEGGKVDTRFRLGAESRDRAEAMAGLKSAFNRSANSALFG